jgi:hypothetical protein
MEHIKLFSFGKLRTHSFAFRQIGLHDKVKSKPHRYNSWRKRLPMRRLIKHFMNTKTRSHEVAKKNSRVFLIVSLTLRKE